MLSVKFDYFRILVERWKWTIPDRGLGKGDCGGVKFTTGPNFVNQRPNKRTYLHLSENKIWKDYYLPKCIESNLKIIKWKLTLRRPLLRKLRVRWFFDVSKVKESSFFKSDLTDSRQIFDAHLLENTDLSPSRFHFSVGFISRSCFESDGLKFIRTN